MAARRTLRLRRRDRVYVRPSVFLKSHRLIYPTSRKPPLSSSHPYTLNIPIYLSTEELNQQPFSYMILFSGNWDAAPANLADTRHGLVSDLRGPGLRPRGGPAGLRGVRVLRDDGLGDGDGAERVFCRAVRDGVYAGVVVG